MNVHIKKVVNCWFVPMFLIFSISNVYAHSCPLNRPTTDVNKLIVFTSNKPFTPIDGTLFVDGLKGDGMHFQKEILQRNDDKIAKDKADAIDFFAKRFGLDVNDTRISFTGFEIAADDRAVVMTGEYVPPKGWKVYDGGWTVIVTDQNGLDLGGEFAGTHVPKGTFVSYGNYLIRKLPYPVLLGYRSKIPSLTGINGTFQIINEISSKQYGDGQVIGGALPIPLANGKLLFNARGVITFPALVKTSGRISR